MTNPHDEARTLMEKLAQIRPRALTAEQLRRRELIKRRNDEIQAVGPKAVDGITFARSKRDKR